MTTLPARVAQIDWDSVSRGQAKGFEAHFAILASADRSPEERTAAREWIADQVACYPIAGLAGRYLVELAADPAAPDLAELLPMLVTCAVGDHMALLRHTEESRRAALEHRLGRLTLRNRFEAVASGAAPLVPHLRHADAASRAGAAFVLAWFARLSTAVVPAATAALEGEASPEARASLALCLAFHGAAEPLGPLLADWSPVVRLAAAIGETLLPADRISERAVALLAESLTSEGAELTRAGVPWGYGDLRALAFARFCTLPERFASTTLPLLFSMLDAPNGRDVAESLIGAAFPAPLPPSSPLSPLQREVLVAIVTRATLWRGGTPQKLLESGVHLGRGRTNLAQREHLRKMLGLPRDPLAPNAAIKTSLTFDGRTQPLVHWWADFEDGAPLDVTDLADAMARALSPAEAVELVAAAPKSEASVAPPPALVPPGGAPDASGHLLWRDVGYQAVQERYREIWQAAGWELLLEQTTTVSWKGTLHQRGQIVEAKIEHDWNQGDPKLDEVSFTATARHALEPSFVRAAGHGAFWDALVAATEKDTKRRRDWPHVRVAILASVELGSPPPEPLDAVALGLQETWAYPQPLFQGYAKILPEARREDLVIAVLSGDEFVMELFALAPTERVLAAIWPRITERFGELTSFRKGALGRLEEQELAATFGPVAVPRLLALAEDGELSPEHRQRAANLARLAGLH
jgi:hypothetical protein